jgi:hypothetical protein
MISSIESLAMSLKPTLNATTGPKPVEPVRPAPRDSDGFDAEKFSRLMETGNSASPPPAVAACDSTKTTECLGDKMLARMSSMGEEFQKTWSEVADVVAGPDNSLSMQDMLRAQMHLVRVAAEYEAIGKAIGKSTQNVDQMLRMQ